MFFQTLLYHIFTVRQDPNQKFFRFFHNPPSGTMFPPKGKPLQSLLPPLHRAPAGKTRIEAKNTLQGATPRLCAKAMPSPSGEGGRRGTSLTDEGSRRETIPVLSPSSAPSAESSRRRKERRRQRSRFLPTMAKTSVRRARTPHRGDAHNARPTPHGEAFLFSRLPCDCPTKI